MALSEQDEQLLRLLATDPVARRELVKHGSRLMPDHPVVRQEAANEVSFEDKVKPLKEEIEDLKKKLLEKTNTDLLQERRASVKGPPFYFTDEQVRELEERMTKDHNLYGSYIEAARYYQFQDQPTHPQTAPVVSPFGRRTKAEQDWRSMIKDPNSRLWKDRKNFTREQWEEGSRELSNRRR